MFNQMALCYVLCPICKIYQMNHWILIFSHMMLCI
jgi:hypothetical protein